LKDVDVELKQARLLLARLLFELRKDVRLVTLWGLLQGLATIAYVLLFAWLLSATVGGTAELSKLIPLMGGVIFALLVRAASFYAQEKSVLKVNIKSERLALRWLINGWDGAAGYSVARDQASLVGEPLQALGPYFSRFRPQMMLAAAIPLFILIIVFWLDWIAGVFLLASAPLIPIFMALVGMGAERVNQQHFALMRRISGLFIDRLRNLTVLKLFNQTEQAKDEVRRASEKSQELNMKTLRVAFLSSAVLEFFSAVAIAAVAIYVGFALLGYYEIGPASRMTWFVGLAVLMLAPEFFQPLRTLSSYYHDRATATGAAAELARYGLNKGLTRVERGSHASGELVVDDLSVSYPGRGQVLHGISLTAKPHTLTWFYGASGAGKSTLLKSIAGLIADNENPNVRIGPKVAAKEAVAYLAQTPFIANASLAHNLTLATHAYTQQDLENVLAQVGLSYLLNELPEGLATPVGTQGTGLSGGEARRVAIARVLLSSAQLVLLDEPTAGLDADSAKEVMAAIQRLVADQRIVLVASHDDIFAAVAMQTFKLIEGRLYEA